MDNVAEEKPLHIFFNNIYYITILCSPTFLEELAVGHAFSEGIIQNYNEIHKISIEEKSICRVQLRSDIEVKKKIELARPFSRLITSSCTQSAEYWPFPKLIDRINLPKVTSKLTVKAETISHSVKSLNFISATFRNTGGVHVAGICKENGKFVATADDVGRHNAVDKVIGMTVLKRVDLTQCFLILSGRLTSDIVLKAVRLGLPIVASKSAPLSSGIEVAEFCKLTLVGFVRSRYLNIYTRSERIII